MDKKPAAAPNSTSWSPFNRSALSTRTRTASAKRLRQHVGRMTTAAVAGIDAACPWFRQLGAEERSWVTMMVTKGIENFIDWFDEEAGVDLQAVFNVAPRKLMRRITLSQTVQLIRTILEVIEQQIQELIPRADRPALQQAIAYYGRELAFTAAELYASAAESRGAWDERMEALLVDAVVRGESDDDLISRASALSWPEGPVAVLACNASGSLDLAAVRTAGHCLDLGVLAARQGERLVLILSDPSAAERWMQIGEQLAAELDAGPVVIGPEVSSLPEATQSANAALAGLRAAKAWPNCPDAVSAGDLLPERLLAGDPHASAEIVSKIYTPLHDAGGDLLLTCMAFLDNNQSIEASARALYVHPNTVRYRIKRITDVTGHSPAEPRGAHLLRLAISLGRLADN